MGSEYYGHGMYGRVCPPIRVSSVPKCKVTRCIYHTRLGRFFKLDCPTTERVPIPNDTYSEISRRDLSNAEVRDRHFQHSNYSSCADIKRNQSWYPGTWLAQRKFRAGKAIILNTRIGRYYRVICYSYYRGPKGVTG